MTRPATTQTTKRTKSARLTFRPCGRTRGLWLASTRTTDFSIVKYRDGWSLSAGPRGAEWLDQKTCGWFETRREAVAEACRIA